MKSLFQQFNKKLDLSTFIDFNKDFFYKPGMSKKTFFNTTLDPKLLKRLKLLAVERNKRINQLLEEAIEDLLNKYSESPSSSEKPE